VVGGILLFILVNTLGAVGILLKMKPIPASPNKYIKPLWVVLAILWSMYMLSYFVTGK